MCPGWYWGQPNSGGKSLDLRPPQILPKISLGWIVAFCSFSFPVSEQAREAQLSGVCPRGTVLVRGGGVHSLLNHCGVDGGTQEHLALLWAVLFPLRKQIQLGWMGLWLLCCFSSPGAAQNLSGMCWDRSSSPPCQRAARAEPATGATSLPLCLETKTKIKHRNGRQGLWMLICGVCGHLSRLFLHCGNCFGKRDSPELS